MNRFPIAVIIEKTRLDNPWASERWEVVGVVPAFGDLGEIPRRIFADDTREQFLAARFDLELFRDEAPGYHLNLTSPEPRVFVVWRLENGFAKPCNATLSYTEAARFMDASEEVDGAPIPEEIANWLGDFVNTHFKPEPRRKVRRNDPFAVAAKS